MPGKAAERARFNMIQQQIRPWEVVDKRVLEVMQALPREAFVPDAYLGLAYADIEIPIGNAQTMMAPKVVGRMLQALAPKSTDRALEIGTGTGYVTACLGRMCRTVVSIELDPELAAAAAKTLVGLDIAGLDLRTGDALADRIEGGPFDVIAVTGSLPSEEPLAQLQAHLAPAGRLFVVTGEAPVMEAWLISRIGEDDFRRQSLFETALTALVGVPEPEHFRF